MLNVYLKIYASLHVLDGTSSSASCFIFGGFGLQFSVWIPAIMTEVLSSFTQSLHANVGINK
jgi:hypothetical protein